MLLRSQRFFYTEARLRQLINVVNLDRSIKANEKLLTQRNIDQTMSSNLRIILEEQKRQFAKINANKRDVALVEANLYAINSVLDLSQDKN